MQLQCYNKRGYLSFPGGKVILFVTFEKTTPDKIRLDQDTKPKVRAGGPGGRSGWAVG